MTGEKNHYKRQEIPDQIIFSYQAALKIACVTLRIKFPQILP